MRNVIGWAVLAGALSLEAAVKLGSPFADGMVLQREKPVAVWGTADAGEEVTVSFAGQSAKAKAGADGKWLVRLAPLAASAESRVLRANNAEVKDVLVGEVWLCSGQSNMSMIMWNNPYIGMHGNRETNGYLDTMMVNEPEVRGCTVPAVWSVEPKELAKPLVWKRFAPGQQRHFSAIAFHYALALHQALKVPVGVIVSAWGGTNIETWISPDGYQSVPGLETFAAKPLLAKSDNPKMELHKQHRALYNAMIHPLLPYTLRGALWYQGESNRGQGLKYKDYLHALWNGWAKAFENPELPFYLVQIAPFDYWLKPTDPGVSACDIWEAEERFAKENKFAGMATIVDVGEHDNIHPGDKRTVALRLAALALNRNYGRTDIPCDNPSLKSYTIEGDTFKLVFDHVKSWVMHGNDPVNFEIAGADGKFVPATAKFLPGAIEVKAAEVAAPKQLRYLWNWQKTGRLKNDYGLPLAPFFIR